MTWFITKTKDNFINRKELPLDNDILFNLPDESQPINIWQSLMQATPGAQLVIPADEPNIIKEALLDCMEMLVDQDQFVINAIIYEQITYPKLADRLRSVYSTCMEANASCVC
ncbi:MAG: hypothetical protein EBR82_11865 [Caulobacteraceae bacterium]|nr:hypothetical protein [Caulobacteraceae bacterium]